MYKIKNNLSGEPYMVIKDNSIYIPFDPANTDYQTYLKWVEAGNTPLPADN